MTTTKAQQKRQLIDELDRMTFEEVHALNLLHEQAKRSIGLLSAREVNTLIKKRIKYLLWANAPSLMIASM